MPLTEAQKIEIRAILRVRQDAISTFPGQSAYDALNRNLAALSSDQLTEVDELLAQWAKVKFATGILKGEYNDDPARKRRLIRQHLITVLNFDPADYGIGGMPELGRG